jgi:hypothetical protein
VVVAFAFAFFACVAVDANLVRDPRYDAEAWLAAHSAPGDRIETYGRNVYLPRFPVGRDVIRVGREPVGARSPLPGVTEIDAPFGEVLARNSRFLVVSDGWVWRYTLDPARLGTAGRILAPTMTAAAEDADATGFFRSLFRGDGPYRLAHAAVYASPIFPQLDIHASTARSVFIFERRP